MNKPTAFHIEYLQTELSKRSQRNPHYSLRSFARDLGVTAGWLSEFLSLKKGMSSKKAQEIATILGLSRQEQDLFVLSAEATHARSDSDRTKAAKELKAYKLTKTFKMSMTEFVEAGAWYHQAILELIETDDFTHTELEISQRLRLPIATIKRALQELQNVGLLEIKNGKMQVHFAETDSTLDRPSSSIRKYHDDILKKAAQALHEQAVEEREFTSVTFAFDSNRMEEAKKALRKMHKAFTDEFYSQTDSKDSVYQFSFQLFRLDTKGNKS